MAYDGCGNEQFHGFWQQFPTNEQEPCPECPKFCSHCGFYHPAGDQHGYWSRNFEGVLQVIIAHASTKLPECPDCRFHHPREDEVGCPLCTECGFEHLVRYYEEDGELVSGCP